ncbi:MAG TPA: hypothetical protein VK395_13710 [Gemmataceae bacterium]|nr:hypothetical protein [Gemmataceae bacterium]
MHSLARWIGWATLLCAGLLGCASASSKLGYPEDPLLIAKKPVEGKPGPAEDTLIAFGEPSPPPLPNEAFVLAPRHRKDAPLSPSDPAVAENKKDDSHPNDMVEISPPNEPEAQPKTGNTVEAIPVSRRKAPEEFGHAGDYSWLQGKLDLAVSSRPELQFSKLADKDVWDGRVILEADARLAQLRNGDVIRVEGELLPAASSPTELASESRPHYRIKAVWLVRRQD